MHVVQDAAAAVDVCDALAREALKRPVLWACSLLIACSTTNDCDLASELVHLAGANATDCGTAKVGSDPASVNACMRANLGSTTPFRAIYQLQGTDSDYAQGVAQDPSGAVFWLGRDSNPCGGGSGAGCHPVISAARCIHPSFLDGSSGGAFATPLHCSSTEDLGLVCP